MIFREGGEVKREFEFDTRYSDRERELEERKNRIKTICFKTCSKCGETKLIFKFSIEKRNTDGRTNVCKACRSLEYLKYYYHNRDKILIQVREYHKNNKRDRSIYFENYRDKNKERLKGLASKWYMSNKEAIKERNNKYYQENKEACQARRELWIIKNKERIREYNREYNLKHKLASQGYPGRVIK